MTFKKGDRVRVNDAYGDFVGKVGVIEFVKEIGPYPYFVSDGIGYVREKEIDRVSDRRLIVRQGDNVTTFEGDFAFEVEDLRSYVQVAYELPNEAQTWKRKYTYLDPTGELKVGDLVEAPTRYSDSQLATVVALGRGSYTGEPRAITARLTREELSAA